VAEQELTVDELMRQRLSLPETITVNGVVFDGSNTHPAVPNGSPTVTWYRNGSTILSYDSDEETWCACVADVAFFEEYRTAEEALSAVDARARKYAGVLTELARLGIGGGK
jgi:hypothetical protein